MRTFLVCNRERALMSFLPLSVCKFNADVSNYSIG